MTSLRINHHKTNKESLIRLCKEKLANSKTPVWEKDVFTFIKNWLDKKGYIEVSTSGSTGKPKTIRLQKDWMIQSAKQTSTFFGLSEQTNALLCLPAAYIGGKMMIVRAFVNGMNLILTQPRSNPFDNLVTPTHFAAITPHQLYASLNTLKNLPDHTTLIVGGGEISPSLEKQVQPLPMIVFATYGMTETSSHIALRQVNGQDKTPFFSLLGQTKIDTDERGCLVLKNPLLFEGKLITNDMVEVKSEKQFRWLGRFDHIINSGGIKVFPEEVEQAIADFYPNPLALIPRKDKKLGEAPVLIMEGAPLTEKQKSELRSRIKNKVHPYATPHDIISLENFPRTPTGKTDRKKLKVIVNQSIPS